jgi:hypothetical protein
MHGLKAMKPNHALFFLPMNTTSIIQPFDASVIQTFKQGYDKLLPSQMMENNNTNDGNASQKV